MRTALLLLGLLIAHTAWAEDIAIYETEGDADAGGNDPRIAALDEAFARAAQAAVGEIVEPDVRKANKSTIDKEIVGRARLWVAKFTVNKDVTNDGRRELTVSVKVDRDKIRGRLAELNIASVVETPKPGSKSVVVLLRVTNGDSARASYGASAEKELPGMGAIASALRGASLSTKRASAAGPAARPGSDIPLDDGDADAFAAESKADLALVAGVSVGEPIAARGVALPAVLVTAHVKLVPRGGSATGQGKAVVAARGTEPSVIGAAIDRALVAAAADVLPAPKSSLTPQAPDSLGDDTPIGQDGVVLVRLPAKTPWGLVVAEQKYLAGARGVQRAVLRRLSPGGWVIGVSTTESIERIASIARKPPASDTSAKVKIVGNIVEVTLSGSP